MQLTIARRLEKELVEELERTTAEIHRSHKRFKRAQMGKEKLETARADLAEVPESEFWHEAAEKAEEAQKDGWCSCLGR